MAFPVVKVVRIAIAVNNLEEGIENWKRLFGIKPIMSGEEPDQGFHWMAFKLGEGDCTVEMFSPKPPDPEGKSLIGKFLKNRGQGIYMITLLVDADSDEVTRQMSELGLTPSWGERGFYYDLSYMDYELKGVIEHYVNPKDTNGVLVTLQSWIYRSQEEIVEAQPAKLIAFK